MTALEVHVVYDDDGRILAIAHATETTTADGKLLSHTPVLAAGQHTTRLTLDDHHAALGAVALVRGFAVDLSSDEPTLRPRSA